MSTEKNAGMWHLDSMDGFDTEAERFRLSGPYGSEEAALAAAGERFAELERLQPSASSGGQGGIQDRLYLVRPDGSSRRLFPRGSREH